MSTTRWMAGLAMLATGAVALGCSPAGPTSQPPQGTSSPSSGGSGGGRGGTGGSAAAGGGAAGTGGSAGQSADPPGSGGSGGRAGGSGVAVDAAPPPPIVDATPAEAPPAAADAGPGAGVTDPGIEGDGDFMVNGPYRLPPEATLAAGVTAGRIAQVMVPSRIFAGSNRTVQVYTPAGYVAGTEAPFMVLQDGPGYISNFRLNTVLDNLIASKKLPVMIAIFVPNGGSNRSFEYDSLTDLYVRFVLEEVLPAVEGGLPVKLTRDPEGRAAGGHSSGGIAAFTMGWLRPDQFRRILTHSGSFTNIRGGDRYPALVRGEAARPLRVFLSAGTMDLQPPRWQQANVTMAAALKEKGYHYRFVLMNGGTHSQSHPAAILPETLLWLWRGYPIP
jgi:enterochelin esterase-like enzyme